MRTWWIVIATGVLGCLTGFGLTYREAVSLGDHFEASYVDENPDTSSPQAAMTGRAVVIGKSAFDFGTLQKDRTGSCAFKIRNESMIPLVVDLEGVSCGLCIQTELSPAEVQGGKEFEFKVDYTTHKEGPEFSEYVEMRTSDPMHPVLRFNITGYVTQSIRFSKGEIVLGSVSAAEDIVTDFRIYGFSDGPLEIVHHEFASGRSADYFKLELTPLEPAAFQEEEPRAKSALQAKLSMTRGKPLGPLKQILLITARMGDETTEAELNIRGTIVSDIVLIGGADFVSDKSLLKFHSVSSAVGHSTNMRIRVHGPLSDQVKLTVGEIDPEGVLTATIGEPTALTNGYLYPLTITIPKGAPTVNRLGSQQGKVGTINIDTTHPSAKQVPIYVSFAVE